MHLTTTSRYNFQKVLTQRYPTLVLRIGRDTLNSYPARLLSRETVTLFNVHQNQRHPPAPHRTYHKLNRNRHPLRIRKHLHMHTAETQPENQTGIHSSFPTDQHQLRRALRRFHQAPPLAMSRLGLSTAMLKKCKTYFPSGCGEEVYRVTVTCPR